MSPVIFNPFTGNLDFVGSGGGGGGGGSTWYTGSGTPGAGVGSDGDFYLNSDNGDYYQKISGTWTLQGNLEGPAGPSGVVTATAPLSYNAGTQTVSISQATTSTNGYLSSTDWNTFNNKFPYPTGTTAQYIRGDGSLATFPTVFGEAQALVTEVYNKSGATITKGSVIYIDGDHGNLPTIALAKADSDLTSSKTYGLVKADISDNSSGWVVHIGLIGELNTNSLTTGVALWLSSTTAGAYTTTKPSAPNHQVFIGICTRSHPTHGTIELFIQNGLELEELHDVAISSPATGQTLRYNSTTKLWSNQDVVLNTLAGSETDKAPSVSSVNTALAGKEPTITKGNLTESTSSVLTVSGGTGAVIGSGTSIQVKQSSASQSGYLSSTDWSTFNGKFNTPSGSTIEYLRGNGTLANYNDKTLGGGAVIYYLNGGTHQGEFPPATDPIFGGLGYDCYQLSTKPDIGTQVSFTAAAGNAIAAFITDANVPTRLKIKKGFWDVKLWLASDGTGTPSVDVAAYYWSNDADEWVQIGFAPGISLNRGATIDLYRFALEIDPDYSCPIDSKIQIVVENTSIGSDVTLYTQGTTICSVDTIISDGIVKLNGLIADEQVFALSSGSYNDVTIGSAGNQHTFYIPSASATKRGVLTSADWSTFNNKEPALTKGNLSGTSPVSVSGGTGAVIGAGSTVSISQATTSTDGYLSSTDWNTFNNKQATITGGATTIISSDLTASRALTSDANGKVAVSATTATELSYVAGVTSGIQAQISGKEPTLTKGNLTEATSSVLTVTGGTGAVIGSGTSIQVKQASGSQSGYLSSTDWTTFNGKQASGNYITALTGDVTATGPGSVAATIASAAVTGSKIASATITSTNISNLAIPLGYLSNTEVERRYVSNAGSASITANGIVGGTTSGTVTLRNVATTNNITRVTRVGFISLSTANSVCGYRNTTATFSMGLGFRFMCGFAYTDAAYASGALQFIGMTATTGSLGLSSTTTVASLQNCIGIGSDATDTNLQIFYNATSASATKIDLGANFPANRTAGAASTEFYTVEIVNLPSITTTVYYRVTNGSGNTASGTISSGLPASTTLLTFQAQRGNGSSAVAVQLDWSSLGCFTAY